MIPTEWPEICSVNHITVTVTVSLLNCLWPDVSRHISLATGGLPMARLKARTDSSQGLNETGKRFALCIAELRAALEISARLREKETNEAPCSSISTSRAYQGYSDGIGGFHKDETNISIRLTAVLHWPVLEQSCFFFAHSLKLSYRKCFKTWPDWVACGP